MSTGWVTKAAAALDRQRVCRPGKQPGKISLMSFHAFAWSVAVLERMGAVNGRSCEQSKLKISLLLARSIYPVLCFGPPIIQDLLSKKTTNMTSAPATFSDW